MDSSPPNPTERFLVATLLALLLLTQGYAAATRSFWDDEVWTAGVVALPVAEVPARVAADSHPPLYFTLATLWARMAGSGELGLRSLSILCTLLTAIALYLLAARLFGRRTALLALALFALSPFVLAYGHTARYYALGGLLATLLMLALHGYRATRHSRYLLLYIAAGVALAYTLYLGALFVATVSLIWLLVILRSGERQRQVRPWLLAHLLIAAAFVAWLPVAGQQSATLVAWPPLGPRWVTGVAVRAAFALFTFSVGESLSPLNPLTWLALGVVAVALVRLLRSRETRDLLLLIGLVLGAAAVVAFVSRYPNSAPQAVARRTYFAFPLLALGVAAGLQGLAGRTRTVTVGVLLLAFVVGQVNYVANREFLQPFLTVNWQQVTDQMAEDGGRPEDIVICNVGDFATCDYYLERAGYTVRLPEAGLVEAERRPDATVWWVQVALSDGRYDQAAESAQLDQLRQGATRTAQWGIAPQDAGIRWMKARLLGQTSYHYRVVLYRFER